MRKILETLKSGGRPVLGLLGILGTSFAFVVFLVLITSLVHFVME